MELITYLLKSAAILTLFYVIYVVLLRKETHFKAHRIFLISGVLGSFLLPLLYFTQTIYIDVPVINEITSVPENMTAFSATSIEPEAVIDWWNVAILSYLIGCSFVLFRFVRQLISLIVLLHNNPGKRYNGFRYVRLSKNIAPFSFFNYIVYNPDLHDDHELKMILNHEQAHAFQWHSADIILANLLIVTQWANPLAWLYKKSVEENLEFLADNATVIKITSKKDYQLALVKASSAHTIPALTTNFYKSFIKKRIIMLNKRTSKKHHVVKVAAVLPLLAVFLWSFNVRETITYNEIPSEPVSVKIPQETIIVEAKEPKAVIDLEEATNINLEENIAGAIASDNTDAIIADESASEIIETISLVRSSKNVEIKITKNTTDAELAQIKADLKRDHDIDFNYSTKRNKNNEITSISIQYTGKGKNGNYSISDDEAISDFVFYMDEDGRSGFYSEELEAYRAERAYARAERMKDRELDMVKRKEGREKIREEIIVERNAVRDEMEQRRKEMKDKMREHKKTILIESDDEGGLFDDDDEEIIVKEYVIAGTGSNEGNDDEEIIKVRPKMSMKVAHLGIHDGDHAIMIDKDTSDETLAKLKKKLAAKGVDIKYNKLKRNSNGEITSIRINVNDNKGSKQTIFAKTDDGDPIDELLIEIH